MGIVAERWFDKYKAEYPLYKDAANVVRGQLEDILTGPAINIHLIEARAKAPDSVAEKIGRHAYGRPSIQFSDLIGVRVITLYDHSAQDVIRRLRSRFDVDESRSSDKTSSLGLRQVGYRSQHLVVKARNLGLEPIAGILRSTFIEIQVRSVISHAWAEIEHSLRYKVGEGIPQSLGRRFDALAGTLELVDREFSNIEKETVSLVDQKVVRYSSGLDLNDSLSTIQLLGGLKCARPDMAALGPDKLVLDIEDAFRYAKILVRCGIVSVESLLNYLAANEVSAAIETYAESVIGTVSPSEISAIAVLGIVIGLRCPDEFRKVQAFTDPKLQAAIGLD